MLWFRCVCVNVLVKFEINLVVSFVNIFSVVLWL